MDWRTVWEMQLAVIPYTEKPQPAAIDDRLFDAMNSERFA